MPKHRQLVLPSLRCHTGNWIYYVSSVRLRDVAERISTDHEFELDGQDYARIENELARRSIMTPTYVVADPERFLGLLVVGVDGGQPEWLSFRLSSTPYLSLDEVSEEDGRAIDNTLGLLKLSGTERLFAINQQGTIEEIRQAYLDNADLEDDEVSVIFVAHQDSPTGLARTNRLFAQLNG